MDALQHSLMEAHETLGLPADCSFEEATKVYRRLAKKFHPDSNLHDPVSSHEMMMKINTAYATIRECHVNGIRLYDAQPAGEREVPVEDHSLRAWIVRFERDKRRQEEERGKKERERQRRDREASQRFWEKVTLERKLELQDRKTYEIIMRYAQKLVSFYFKMNFQNHHFRARPYVREDFAGYLAIYKQRLRRISALKGSNKSVMYKKKSSYAYAFLKSFINDTLKPHSVDLERRASALDIFQKAVRFTDKFMVAYFSGEAGENGKAIEVFKQALDHFETFLKSYPESPLVEYAFRKVDVLDKMYRAFLKDR